MAFLSNLIVSSELSLMLVRRVLSLSLVKKLMFSSNSIEIMWGFHTIITPQGTTSWHKVHLGDVDSIKHLFDTQKMLQLVHDVIF